MDMENSLLVIDIGTRFVRGLLCLQAPSVDGMRPRMAIVDREIIEHETRAMRAGQIHDVEAVVQTVRRIKEALAHRAGRELTKVAVAVAGRNLATCRGNAELPRAFSSSITPADVRKLEIAAVQNALETMAMDEAYYCVGYSLIAYTLDGEEIASLVDHRAETIGAEVLVTLLPRQVLEAMFTVMSTVGLEIEYVTLEPIAALEATVSERLRPLSLVLVDIGAGTSDIAVTAGGKVLAYGMAPVAGDMITESLCREYHIDFFEAERLKRAGAGSPDAVMTVNNIFNRPVNISAGELQEKLRPAVRLLAERIFAETASVMPQPAGTSAGRYAVVLVGGGSMTPLLEDEVAGVFGISREHVGIRPVSFNHEIEDATGSFSGPDAATAVGIGLLALRRPGLVIMHLAVNDKRVTVITDEKNPPLLSALLASGIPLRQIYGRPGMAKTFTLNGVLMSARGELPRPAVVELNGIPAALDAPVQEGDRVTCMPAVDGKDAEQCVGSLVALPRVWFNGRDIAMPVTITMNGAVVPPDTLLTDRADITYVVLPTLHAVLRAQGIDVAAASAQSIVVDVDGEYRIEQARNYTLLVDGAAVSCAQDIQLQENARIDFAWVDGAITLGSLVPSYPPSGRGLRVRINGQDYLFPGGQGKILVNGQEAALDTLLRSGDSVRTVAGKDAEAVLVDVFRYITVNPQDQAGKRMRLLINGQESQYTSVLNDNADVSVMFE